MTFAELQDACTLFGLGKRATLAEIKRRHRELVKRCHPDSADGGDQEAIRQGNAAYRILHEYLLGYRFSFSEEEFYEQNREERLRRQFMSDPVWGKG